jgi:hypothetical protein
LAVIPGSSQISTLTSAPRFEFITTTGPNQYSAADARTRARAHIMRQVHVEKDKERASRTSTNRRHAQYRNSVECIIKRTNLGLIWHGQPVRNLRPAPFADVPGSVVTQPIHAAQVGPDQRPSAPIRREFQSYFTAASTSESRAAQVPQLSSRPVFELDQRGAAPLVPLGGMQQRLVVPRTMNVGDFAVDLDALENVRYCKFKSFTIVPFAL